MKSSILLTAATALMVLMLVAALNTNRQLRTEIEHQRKTIEAMEWKVDSLSDETFSLTTQLMRVEITLEHLNEVDPKAFIEFSRYYDHETE